MEQTQKAPIQGEYRAPISQKLFTLPTIRETNKFHYSFTAFLKQYY